MVKPQLVHIGGRVVDLRIKERSHRLSSPPRVCQVDRLRVLVRDAAVVMELESHSCESIPYSEAAAVIKGEALDPGNQAGQVEAGLGIKWQIRPRSAVLDGRSIGTDRLK
jgi:hypothetical protein